MKGRAMNKKPYRCEGGSIRIWFGGSYATFGNDFGDGMFPVSVKAQPSLRRPRNYKFQEAFYSDGTAIVDGVDYGEKLEDLFVLPQGRYGVYANKGNIIIQRWDNNK